MRCSNRPQRMRDKLASPAVQAGLSSGNLAAAAIELQRGWARAEHAQVLPPDLQAAYAALPQAGFGRLAVAEAALAADAPVARIAKDGEPALLVAAPAKVGARLVGVAVIHLPLSIATDAVQAANVGDDSYMALRQGNYSVLERGDTALATSAEALGAKIPDSDLRIAAALPDAAQGPFGLGAIPAFIAALVLLGLAFAAWFGARRLQGLVPAKSLPTVEAEPTLSQMQPAPPPREAPVVTVKEAPKASPVKIDRGIFRAYDIRGVVGNTLDAGVAELIGHAIGTLMFEKGLTDIVVGRDGRLSGPDLVAGLIEGLRRAGRNVIDIGLAPTPLVYFGGYHLRTGCGVAVTGSHNPPDYNGFKVVVGGETLSGDAITDLYARIAEDRLHNAASPARSRSATSTRTTSAGSAPTCRSTAGSRSWSTPAMASPACSARACWKPSAPTSPRCIARSTAPSPTTIPTRASRRTCSDLIQMVQRLDADIGLAFDGDGDRLGVVTRDGEIIYPRPPADAVRQRRARAQPGRDDHLRRQVHRPPAGPHPAPRRQPADVEDRPFADQGQDARDRRRAGRRDERPLLLRRALVRLRRRHLCRARACWRSWRRSRRRRANSSMRCPMACRRRRSRSMRPKATACASSSASSAQAKFEGGRISPSTACAWTGRTAGAWCARPTPRRCW